MPIRILVNGAHGRMGQEAIKTISNQADFELVAQAGRGDDLAALIKLSQAQVVLDLSIASVVYENLITIINANVHPVIGTSGLLPAQIVEMQQRCAQKKLGGIIAPNFSLGAVLMMHFAQLAAPFFPDVEIIEMHHDGKEDAPSGTAIKTANLIAAARITAASKKNLHETVAGSRGARVNEIPVHAIRLPGVVAAQEVIFGGQGETLSIRDNAINREAYMPGICLACRKVMTLSELIYGLEKIIIS